MLLIQRSFKLKSRKMQSSSKWETNQASLLFINLLKWSITWKFKISSRKECSMKLKVLPLVQISQKKSTLRSVKNMPINYTILRKNMIWLLNSILRPLVTSILVMLSKGTLKYNTYQTLSDIWKDSLKLHQSHQLHFKTWAQWETTIKITQRSFWIAMLKWNKKIRSLN